MENEGLKLRNDYIKIDNPTLKYSSGHTYIGNNFDTFDWGNQNDNYTRLQNLLLQNQLKLTLIYSSKIYDSSITKHYFVVETSNPDIIWISDNSDNWIYYKKYIMKLSDFLKYKSEDMKELYKIYNFI